MSALLLEPTRSEPFQIFVNACKNHTLFVYWFTCTLLIIFLLTVLKGIESRVRCTCNAKIEKSDLSCENVWMYILVKRLNPYNAAKPMLLHQTLLIIRRLYTH